MTVHNSSTKSIEDIKLLFENAEYENVIKSCKKLINHSSRDFNQYLLKASAERKLGDLEEAHQTYIDGLREQPGHPLLLSELAKLYIIEERLEDALKILKPLADLYPNDESIKKNYKGVQALIKKRDTDIEHSNRITQASRPFSPLESAFSNSEIEESRKNLSEKEKFKRKKKLKRAPSLPHLQADVLAEEWALAAEDALRAKHPDITLLFCSKIAENDGDPSQVYNLAGDAYIQLKQFIYAHLCYMIASEYKELDSSRSLNLISLAATIGDRKLLEKRAQSFEEGLEQTSGLFEQSQKMLSSLDKNAKVSFDPKKGPHNTMNKKRA